MYRIVINPSDGKWIIQLQVYGFFWKQIGEESYVCFMQAREAADELGLDHVYRNYAKSYSNYVMQGAS